MNLIPPFDWHRVCVEPWQQNAEGFFYVVLMGFLVAAACGVVGNFLMLRRMALIGDAISHSVLPGLVLAFLVSKQRESLAMFIGALAAGIITTVIIEFIHRKTRVKQDAAIGITFSTLFAVGVILVALFSDKVDLDQDCVLYGEIAYIALEPVVNLAGLNLGPISVVRMAGISFLLLLLLLLFYKELVVSSFDGGLAKSLGINTALMHYGLMAVLSLVVVSAFESVGAILVVAMLIVPGATARLLSQQLLPMLGLTVLHAALSSLLGLHLAIWLDCSVGAAMVSMGTIFFGLAWFFNSYDGIVIVRLRNLRMKHKTFHSVNVG